MTQVVIPPGTETEASVTIELPGGGRGIVGTAGPDRLPGSRFGDIMSGLAEDDLIAGGRGDDDILMGFGADTAVGGPGNDSIQANRGIDSLIGGEGDDCLRGGKDNDIIEDDLGNDSLFGDRGDDIISSGRGNDYIEGRQENDIIDAGDDDDLVLGGKGNDAINGGAGNDTIWGDRGNDNLTGGAGADLFSFQFSPDGSYGTDTITDFNAAEGDRIGLNTTNPFGANFEALGGTGPLPPELFAAVENFDPAAGEVAAAIIYDPAQGLIYYNPTPAVGDEAVIAQVNPGTSLDSTSFEIF